MAKSDLPSSSSGKGVQKQNFTTPGSLACEYCRTFDRVSMRVWRADDEAAWRWPITTVDGMLND